MIDLICMTFCNMLKGFLGGFALWVVEDLGFQVDFEWFCFVSDTFLARVTSSWLFFFLGLSVSLFVSIF